MADPRETRDEFGRVLCEHGRPIMCDECGEDYADELNSPVRRRLRQAAARLRVLAEAPAPQEMICRQCGAIADVAPRMDPPASAPAPTLEGLETGAGSADSDRRLSSADVSVNQGGSRVTLEGAERSAFR